MGWKQKSCIVTTMFLICGADVVVMPQEVAAAVQEEGQNFVQIGMSEVETLLKQGKYGEAEAKCRELQEYTAGENTFNFQVLHTLGGIYRLEGKPAAEIALWQDVYEKLASIFKVNNTQELLRPLGELCSAYQAAGDFSSAEPYVRRGEEILREHAGENLEGGMKDISFFRTVALFQRIGTGKITPADASKEAAELLKDDSKEIKPGVRECGWLAYYPWCELELLDIVWAAAVSSYTFPKEVEDCRRDDDTMILLQGSDRVEKMRCMGRAAYAYMFVLGRSKDAGRILAPLYQEVKRDYRHPGTQQEADAMLGILYVQGSLFSFSGNHPEAITTGDMAWELYENTSKSRDVQDALVSLFGGIMPSCQAMNEPDKLKTILMRMEQVSESGSFVACYVKMLNVFADEKSNEDEIRKVLLSLRAAADKECEERPDRASNIRKMMQVLADMMPKRWASVIRSEQDAIVSQDTQAFGEKTYISRLELYTAAEKAYNSKNYQEAASLYERVMELSRAAGEEYGEITIKAVRGLARSCYLLGYQTYRAGNKTDAKKIMDRGLDLFDELIDMHESHRKEHFDGLSPEERGKWFSNVVNDYMEAVLHFHTGSNISLKNDYFDRKIFDTLEKCKARILLEQFAEQNNSKPKILTCEAGQELLSRMPHDTAFFEYVMRRSENYSRWTDMLDFYSLTKTGVHVIGQGNLTFWDDWFAYYKLLSYPDYESFSQVYWLWKIKEQGNVKEHYVVTMKGEAAEGGQLLGSRDDPLVNERNFANARKELAEKWGKLFDFHFTNNLGIQHGMRIIISPDDAVPLLPFETLTCDGKPFAELYEISYAPSLSVYALMKERGETNTVLADRKDLFAMGNAIYDYTEDVNVEKARGGSFKELPETATELNQVGELFQEEKRTLLQQEDASEPMLKSYDESGELARYKYLLFATHGIFEEENPLANAIVLSQPDKRKSAADDGYVTVGEWMNYKLHSDLVYLSACNSGRGTKFAGEGLIGLPYALTLAGNKSTIMTLWEIGDDAAAAFSTAFFTHLTGGQSASQALAKTKREFLHHEIAAYRDPHVWGAFQLYGE